MIELTGLKEGIEGLSAGAKKFDRDVRFCNALALTRTAWDSKDDVAKGLADNFILKNKWTQKGIRTKSANKKDLNPFSTVFSEDWYIVEHETGARRRLRLEDGRAFAPYKPQGSQLEAVREVFGIPRNKMIPQKAKPKALISGRQTKRNDRDPANRVFYAEPGGRGDVPVAGIYKIHNGRRRLLWVQVNEVKINKREWFQEVVKKSYLKNFKKNYDQAYADYVFPGYKS